MTAQVPPCVTGQRLAESKAGCPEAQGHQLQLSQDSLEQVSPCNHFPAGNALILQASPYNGVTHECVPPGTAPWWSMPGVHKPVCMQVAGQREHTPFLTATHGELCWLWKGGIAVVLCISSYLGLTQIEIDQKQL